jgi:arylsulfatase A-like enzyme
MTVRQPFQRRDSLKLLSLLPLLMLEKHLTKTLISSDGKSPPGVILIILDALSAANMSLYGYSRGTTENLSRFASRAYVYHNHYSTSNFTSSGTASILTGLYPWNHRAIHYEGQVLQSMTDRNLFRYWNDSTFRLAFTQNPWVEILLNQFSPWIERHVDLRTFSLDSKPIHSLLFRNDPINSYNAIDGFLYELEPGLSASSVLALFRKIHLRFGKSLIDGKYSTRYPLGIPQTLNDLDVYFLLEDLFDGIAELVNSLPPSSLAYLHLYPPHHPYSPRAEFIDIFKDNQPFSKAPPAYFLSTIRRDMMDETVRQRDLYDSYVTNVDYEFGRLYDQMLLDGVLDRNYVIVTSDHGELFERGIIGHTNEYLYEPLIHVPLIISCPGQGSRIDVFSPTSSVDLVPTLLALANKTMPGHYDGRVLPALGGLDDERYLISIDAKNSPAHGPITTATLALRADRFKIIGYYGYKDYPNGYELYDINEDPNELENLTLTKPSIFAEMRALLDARLESINESSKTNKQNNP